MLTRLRVRGFKNLANVDVFIGPLTCVAGVNGVGKSNLFDAILFLRELADRPFVEAATRVRGGENIADIFTRGGNGRLEIEAEMIIQREGIDEFGQRAEATSTFVRYGVHLRYRPPSAGKPSAIEMENESLEHINREGAHERLCFESTSDWQASAMVFPRTRKPYIETVQEGDRRIVRRRPEGRGGRPAEFPLETLPRTVLSEARNAQEGATPVLVRQEMLSWRLLQLEPSALRRPSRFRDPDRIAADGSNLAATLYRLTNDTRLSGPGEGTPPGSEQRRQHVLQTVSNRLAELVEGVGDIRLDRDDAQELYTLMLRELEGVELSAASLSDGTLRFLALAVMELDPSDSGAICMEEPENGIHPERVEAMLRLLTDLAVGTEDAVGPDNPLRQVICNTHSPVLVALMPHENLLFAQATEEPVDGNRVHALRFRYPKDTRRQKQARSRPLDISTALALLEGAKRRAEQTTGDRHKPFARFVKEQQLESGASSQTQKGRHNATFGFCSRFDCCDLSSVPVQKPQRTACRFAGQA